MPYLRIFALLFVATLATGTPSSLYERLLGLLDEKESMETRGGPCPQDFVRYKDSCYFFSRNPLSWRRAKSECELKVVNAHLVTVNDEVENDYLKKRSSMSEDVNLWIGLSNVYDPNTGSYGWQWTDSSRPTFVDWYTDYPTQIGHCVMYRKRGFPERVQWMNYDCGVALNYICEYEI